MSIPAPDTSGRRLLRLFVLGLAGPWLFLLLLPLTRWGEVASAVSIVALIMLGFAVLGALGMRLKGDADWRDVTAGALGMLAHAALFGWW